MSSLTEERKTKKFHVRVYCQASYESEIEVPADFTYEQAIQYAEDHIDEIPLGDLEYLPDSDEIDEEDRLEESGKCYFTDF